MTKKSKVKSLLCFWNKLVQVTRSNCNDKPNKYVDTTVDGFETQHFARSACRNAKRFAQSRKVERESFTEDKSRHFRGYCTKQVQRQRVLTPQRPAATARL
jgi:hypothetical protein